MITPLILFFIFFILFFLLTFQGSFSRVLRDSTPRFVGPSVTLYFMGSGPEWADDLCFHTGEISPPPSPPLSSPYPLPPGLHAQNQPLSAKPSISSNPSLEAQIPILRLKSQPWSSNPSLKTQILFSTLKSQRQSSNPSLQALIPALRLK